MSLRECVSADTRSLLYPVGTAGGLNQAFAQHVLPPALPVRVLKSRCLYRLMELKFRMAQGAWVLPRLTGLGFFFLCFHRPSFRTVLNESARAAKARSSSAKNAPPRRQLVSRLPASTEKLPGDLLSNPCGIPLPLKMRF